MKMEPILEELEQVAAKLQVRVSYEVLAEAVGGGGLCKVKGVYRVIIDKRATVGEKVATLARALAVLDLEGIFITPAARDLVDRYRAAIARSGGQS
jgi:hypothetical protein